jgi:hypothetical protein
MADPLFQKAFFLAFEPPSRCRKGPIAARNAKRSWLDIDFLSVLVKYCRGSGGIINKLLINKGFIGHSPA